MEHLSLFESIGLHDRPAVGGKGGSLGELWRAGIAVPPGFVVRTSAFELFLASLDADGSLRARVEALDPDDLDAVTCCSREVRAAWEAQPMPAALAAELATAHEALSREGNHAVAVRSSATTEDAADASFAGLQDTYLWVLGREAMLESVRRCWASLYSVESICYRRRRGFPESGVAMAVVVQAMVDARTAGVMFTRSPTTGDRSVITLEGAWGLGSSVVSGEVTPDRWVMGKITGEISVRDISDKAIRHAPLATGGTATLPVDEAERRIPCLSDQELQALRAIGRAVEKHYGCPQDIEWAVDRVSGRVLLLQSRPETVWSARDAAPVAKGASHALDHVMAVFGGRR